MRHLILGIAVLTATLASSQSAWAFTVNVVDTSRTLQTIEGTNGITSSGTSSTGTYSNLLDPLGAQLQAEFASSSIPASGSYSTYVVDAQMFAVYDEGAGPLDWGIATAETTLTFSVDTTVNYSIGASAVLNGTLGGADISLTGPSGEVCSLSGCFMSSGVLAAGQYHLYALAGAGKGNAQASGLFGDATVAFDLTLSAVPEPTTSLLLATGLVGLAWMGRRIH